MKFLKSIFRDLFSEEISSLQKQIQSFHLAVTEKNATINRIIQEKQSLEAYINSCNHEIFRLRNQEKILSSTIMIKVSELTSQSLRLTALENSLSSKQSEAHILKWSISENIKKAQSLVSENKKLNNKITDLNQLISDNNVKIRQLENSLKFAHQHVERLNTKKNTLENKIAELNNQFNEEKKITTAKEKEILKNADEIRAKETDLLELKDLNESLQNEVNRLSTILSECKDEISTITSKNFALESEHLELVAKLEELQSRQVDVELLTAQKNDIKQKQDNITSLETENQRLNEEISDLHIQKANNDSTLAETEQECEYLKKELQNLSTKLEGISKTEKNLKSAEMRIAELENKLSNSPTSDELITRDKIIEKLKTKISEYEKKISELEAQSSFSHRQESTKTESHSPGSIKFDSATNAVPKYSKPKFPYRKKPIAPSKDVITVDFPIIENDNVYSLTERMIDKVFNHRSNSYITANEIFLRKPTEEISRIRFELEKATKTGVPYLTCPCCGNMVKISSRRVGFGLNRREVQYFTHAVRNLPCDLKRDNFYTLTIEEGEMGSNDFSYLNELRHILASFLTTDISKNKGISNVEECTYIYSDKLSKIKRLADVAARYNDIDLVFELVTPTTNIARVHDRDIFYLISNRQVFWIFGLEAIVDYNELKRSVSKDIFFTNKRNVFVFDLDAQQESKIRGELMLKCNWLDEDGEWYFQFDKNGKNGILVSLDQIHFDPDDCRPYYHDADAPFYLKHPLTERPPKNSREKMKEDFIKAWNYDQELKRAIEQIIKENSGVKAYSDGKKWGFMFNDIVFIDPIFDSKPVILGNFAKVEKDSKFGVVNRYGEYRLKPQYERVELLPNGYILYADRDKWYLLDVIEPVSIYSTQDEVIVSTISKPSSIYRVVIRKRLFKAQQPEELYFIGNEIFKKDNWTGKWSLWQSNGEKITDISWDSFELTSEDTIKVSVNGRVQLLSLDGAVIEEQKYKSENRIDTDCTIVETFDDLYGIVDGNGTEIVAPIYDEITPLDKGYLRYKVENLWGIITVTGKVITDTLYHSIDGFDGEYFSVTILNKMKGWGYLSGKVDLTGKPVSEFVTKTETGASITKSFEKFGLEKDNIILIPHIYESLSYWGEDIYQGNGKYIAQKDGKFGIIEEHNDVLLEFEYSSISPLVDSRSTVKKGISQYQIDSNLKIVEELVINLQDGFKKIKLGGKWGILDPQGQVIVDFHYDEISTFRGRLVGIINGDAIKLNAYYPYKLSMEGEFAGYITPSGSKKPHSYITIGNVLFRQNDTICKPKGSMVKVCLINMTSTDKYPTVKLSEDIVFSRKARHIDKPEDYITGESYKAEISAIIESTTRKGKYYIKGFDIEMDHDSTSHIYKRDIIRCGLNPSELSVGDKLIVTKLGYNEELDCTIWRIGLQS